MGKKRHSTVNILAVDPSRMVGWAHSAGGFGTWDLTGSKGLGAFLVALRQRVLMFPDPIDHLVVEEAVIGSRNHGQRLWNGSVRGVLILVAEERGATWKSYVPGSVKKWATGSGGSPKNPVTKGDMIRACEEQLRVTPADEHQADALWMLHMARNGADTGDRPHRPEVAAAKPPFWRGNSW